MPSVHVLISIISVLVSVTPEAQPIQRFNFCQNTTSIITANSSYQSNLDLLLASLTSKSNATLNTGFYNTQSVVTATQQNPQSSAPFYVVATSPNPTAEDV
ncbi:hypothetical protein PanWU01x14_285050 [Parasponia andersonii]|uniref:Uncharacterized protein n=1 Tax=Parasponia andersonii TaxID=3476 RepID=A0A2P5AZX6_PARAD|nr:hypothetical protein PanWU01x14_285050 [Parasponia andersonii]